MGFSLDHTIESPPRGVKNSGKDGSKTVVTALYSAAVNKADDDDEKGRDSIDYQ